MRIRIVDARQLVEEPGVISAIPSALRRVAEEAQTPRQCRTCRPSLPPIYVKKLDALRLARAASDAPP